MLTFKDFGLSAEIQTSLDELGFVNPTPIQAKTIPFILESRQNLIALAQTGTGKTAGFALPILNQLKSDSKDLQAIILCPTRELCLQISKDIEGFLKNTKNVTVTSVFGGSSIELQIRALKKGTSIVVGTPGRVHDLIRRKVLKLGHIQWLVLDEADEMLDMGFKEDLDAVLAETPETKQTLLFSATMSKSVYAIAQKYMKGFEEISVAKKNIGADSITHEYYVVQGRDRYEALRRIVDVNPDIYGILFCRTRRETQDVADKLQQDRYSTEALHGEITQNTRTSIMEKFRQRKIQLLVATDVAARGIDVSDLTHVINYNLPDANETYTHRSGRTGRAQKKGTSITIVTPKEVRRIGELEQKIGQKFTKKTVPQGQDICEVQLFHLIDKLKNIDIDESQVSDYLPAIRERLADLDRDELIKRLVLAEFNHFLNLYKDSKDLNSFVSKERGLREDRDMTSIRINLGKKDRFEMRDLFGFINQHKALKGAEIGKIDIQGTFSVFGIESRLADLTVEALMGEDYRGRMVEARIYNEGRSGGSRSRSKFGGREFRKDSGRKRSDDFSGRKKSFKSDDFSGRKKSFKKERGDRDFKPGKKREKSSRDFKGGKSKKFKK